MIKNSDRLYLDDYLKSPNHYSLQSWYFSDDKDFEEVQNDDRDMQWNKYCEEKGLYPFDDNIPTEVEIDFYDNNIERDLWLVFSGNEVCSWNFKFKIVFFSALLDEMEFTEDQKNDIFDQIMSAGDLYIRYHYFPRRIDLFPLRGPSIALQLFTELDKDSIDNLQLEY